MKQSYTANKIKLAKDQSYVRLYFKKLRKTDRYVGYPDLPRAHYDTFVEIFEFAYLNKINLFVAVHAYGRLLAWIKRKV